jgi:hypothetical protein
MWCCDPLASILVVWEIPYLAVDPQRRHQTAGHYSLTVRRYGTSELRVGGSHPLHGSTQTFQIVSSSKRARALDDDLWPVGFAFSINARLGGLGDEKGRVLAVWTTSGAVLCEPIAAIAWHQEGSGPLYVFDCTARKDMSVGNRPLGPQLTAILLDVLCFVQTRPVARIPVHWQRKLRWSQQPLARAPRPNRPSYMRENLRRAKELGFVKLHPPGLAPIWASSAWLGERSF